MSRPSARQIFAKTPAYSRAVAAQPSATNWDEVVQQTTSDVSAPTGFMLTESPGTDSGRPGRGLRSWTSDGDETCAGLRSFLLGWIAFPTRSRRVPATRSGYGLARDHRRPDRHVARWLADEPGNRSQYHWRPRSSRRKRNGPRRSAAPDDMASLLQWRLLALIDVLFLAAFAFAGWLASRTLTSGTLIRWGEAMDLAYLLATLKSDSVRRTIRGSPVGSSTITIRLCDGGRTPALTCSTPDVAYNLASPPGSGSQRPGPHRVCAVDGDRRRRRRALVALQA